MRYVILGLLLTGPLSLYDVHKRFTASVSLFYSASFGSLQRALTHLVEQGLVTVSDDPTSARRKKLHTITDDGRVRWRDWMLEPIPAGADAETLMLAKVFLLGHLTSRDDRTRVLDLVHERAASTFAELSTLAARVDAGEPDVPDGLRRVFDFQRATLDHGLRASSLALTWIDELRETDR